MEVTLASTGGGTERSRAPMAQRTMRDWEWNWLIHTRHVLYIWVVGFRFVLFGDHVWSVSGLIFGFVLSDHSWQAIEISGVLG